MSITKHKYGALPHGDEVWLYTLDNGTGLRVELLSYGAIVKSIQLKDRSGSWRNVVLGYDNLLSYINDTAYLGATIGRYCNRIAQSRFPLAGSTVSVTANEGANQLHGGPIGFNRRAWSQQDLQELPQPSVVFAYDSPAGEQGFPGNLRTTVSYRLSQDNALWIQFAAQTDATTIVNLTNHSYFNLHGDRTQAVLDHNVSIDADHFLPVDASFIPIGKLQSVEATPFDLRNEVTVADALTSNHQQLCLAGGFDHTWVLNNTSGALREVATATSLRSGIGLTVQTTQPGLQFYTGNHLPAAGFVKHAAFCFETQHFPDSPNQAHFPSTVLNPGEEYKHTTVYTFKRSSTAESE